MVDSRRGWEMEDYTTHLCDLALVQRISVDCALSSAAIRDSWTSLIFSITCYYSIFKCPLYQMSSPAISMYPLLVAYTIILRWWLLQNSLWELCSVTVIDPWCAFELIHCFSTDGCGGGMADMMVPFAWRMGSIGAVCVYHFTWRRVSPGGFPQQLSSKEQGE